MIGEPSLHRCNLAIRQQCYNPPSLQITDDCSLAMILAEGPIINAGDAQRLGPRAGSSPNDPQQGIITHRQHQSLGEACCRPATERKTQIMDDIFQPRCSARPHRDNVVTEPLGENPPTAMRDLTNEPPRDHPEAYLSARAGQIRDSSDVSAMNSARRRPA
jgi:hypothetical protein